MFGFTQEPTLDLPGFDFTSSFALELRLASESVSMLKIDLAPKTEVVEVAIAEGAATSQVFSLKTPSSRME